MSVKITTFNVENLFNRYAFLDTPWEGRNYEQIVQAVGLVSIGDRQGGLVSYEISEIARNNTAQAILDAAPDILAVQEVENLYTLRNFNDTFLDNYFGPMILIDGNDPRGIDVGLLIRRGFPGTIQNVRTHADDGVTRRSSVVNQGYMVTGAIFSRDCLEVDILINGKTLTFLVNHLKAQDKKNPSSIARRRRQAEEVVQFAKAAADDGKLPVVLGDLNVDFLKPVTPGDNSLEPLVNADFLKDPFPAGTWTHYYTPDKEISRLDYIFVHKSLTAVGPDVIRKGLTTKCQQYTGPRYPTIGPEHTEASDHCPTKVVLEL
jgi:endonuclease/exonuclease/phosphatase family metal-dependent hydrolase